MPEFAVHVTTTARVDPDDDTVWDELIDALEPFGAAFGASTPNGDGLDVQMTVEADNLHDASRWGTTIVVSALAKLGIQATAEAVEAMTMEAFEREIEHPARPTDLVSTSEAAAILGVSRQRVFQLAESHPQFPEETRIGDRWYWSAAALHRFQAMRERQRVSSA